MTIAFVGSFINPLSFGKLEYIPHAICSVDNLGKITTFKKYESSEEIQQALQLLDSAEQIVILKKEEFFCPGLVDCHAHAPQIRNVGVGMNLSLLEWLDQTTFPEEASYHQQPNENFEAFHNRVATIYQQMVKLLLRNGTTTCCYFGSLHNGANCILVKVIAEMGQRALVGKVCMDCNSPSYYIENTETSIKETGEFIKTVKEIDSKLPIPETILPIVTPRFALSCSSSLMAGLAHLAIKHKVHIQTHMSENIVEIKRALELFPLQKNYTEIYDVHGLLTTHTILAHCIYLSENEQRLLSERGVGVAHCPNSNFSLNSGVMNARAIINAGINVGLGTDFSGGSSVSILDTMRQAIIASKVLYFQDSLYMPLNNEEVFYLATLGGAKALKLDNCIGDFAVGKSFDAIRVKPPEHYREIIRPCKLSESFERFVSLGDNYWISSTFVNGRAV